MKPHYISIVEPVSRVVRIETKDSYEVRLDRPYPWLQRLCCRILHKLGAYREVEVMEHSVRSIDVSVLPEAIEREIQLAYEYGAREPSKIYMGQMEFSQLYCVPVHGHVLRFRSMSRVRTSRYSTGQEYMGFEVIVLPWMSGILVTD